VSHIDLLTENSHRRVSNAQSSSGPIQRLLDEREGVRLTTLLSLRGDDRPICTGRVCSNDVNLSSAKAGYIFAV